MSSTRRTACRLLVTLCLIFVSAASFAGTITTYTYKGGPFTFLLGTTCPPECNLFGSFTLPDPIGANATNAFVTPLSFSFTDGVVTITNQNATGADFGFISTDDNGVITSWNMDWFLSDYSMFSGTNPSGCTGCSVIDVTFNTNRVNTANITVEAAVNDSPGLWSTRTSTIPEPPDLLLVAGAMLCALATMRKGNAAKGSPASWRR